MKNSATKWLLVTFLIGLSVLSFALYNRYFSADQPDVPQTPAQAEPELPAPDKTSDSDEELPKIVYNQFPRKASVYENMAAQNIGGLKKETLFEVYNVSGYYYLFFDSTSDSYDVNSGGAEKSAVMAKVSASLTLESVSVLAKSESFSAVKITPDGFFVVTTGAEFCKLYNVSFDGKVQSSAFLEKSSDAYAYLSSGEVLCFLARPGKLEARIYSSSLDLLRTSSAAFEGATDVFSVFPAVSGFDVVAASESCFKVFNFNRNDGFVGEKLSVNARLCNFEPTVTDGKQTYFFHAETNDSLMLATLDDSFSVTRKTTLDKPEKAFSVPLENGILLLASSNEQTKWLLFCEHLDFVMRADVSTACDELYFHTKSQNGETLCFLSDQSLVYADFSDGKLNVLHSFEGAFGAVYSADAYAFCGTAKNGFFQSSFGDADVFLLRPSDMKQ